MGLRINQNIDAVNSYRNLSVTQGQMSKSLEKLSSGFRINRAADDAAGLAISEGLRSQVGGLKVAVRNAQDGIAVVQTAEGALTEVHSMLQRMNDLSVQHNNGTQNTESQAALEAEFDAAADRDRPDPEQHQVQRRRRCSTAAGTRPSRSARQQPTRSTSPTPPRSADFTAGDRRADRELAITRQSNTVQAAITAVSTQRAELGAMQNRFEHTINNLNVAVENLSASRVADPRHRHGAGDDELHPLADPVPGRHRDAGAGQPGPAGRPVPPPLIAAEELTPTGCRVGRGRRDPPGTVRPTGSTDEGGRPWRIGQHQRPRQRPRHRVDHRPVHAARGGPADAAQVAREPREKSVVSPSSRSTPRSPPWPPGPADLAKPAAFNAVTATSSDTKVAVTATGVGGARRRFSVRVDQTAASHRLELADAVGADHRRRRADDGAAGPPRRHRPGRPHHATARSPGLVDAINDPANATGLRATAVKVGTDQYRLVVESADHRCRRRLHAHRRRRRLRPARRARPSAPVATPRSRSATPSSRRRRPTPSPTSCPA